VIGVLKKPVPVSGTRNTGSKIRDFGILLYKCHFLLFGTGTGIKMK
jgi:hypothetical protein